MSKNKQYKNVYTILEKVKKGEIQSNSYYQSKDGLFGKLDFYKKPDLIKPHMHYLDSDRLERLTRMSAEDKKYVQEVFNKFKTQSKFAKIDDSKKPDMNKFYESVATNHTKFPKHIVRDIYKMFYHKMDHLEFEERTDKNKVQFRFLERANNPVGKIMTEQSNLKSTVFARNILMYYLTQMTVLEYLDPEAYKNAMNSLNGKGDDGEFDPNNIDQTMKDFLDSKFSQDMLEKAMDQAQNLCNNIDETIPEEVQQKMFEEANKSYGSDGADKLSPDYIRTVTSRLASIRMSLNGVKEKIKKLLDRSTAYFSSREIVTYDDLFNSDNLAGLDEYVMLHPTLRKFMAEDVMIKDVKKVGKLDIYIDVSGSMSSSCGQTAENGIAISKIDFSKAFAAKLKEMDILNNVYLFDTRVHNCGNDIISISMIDAGGGTDIDKAVNRIEQGDNNAIIITDAEDQCSRYSSKVFFIGVQGARFHHFNPYVLPTYSQNRQIVEFDGTNIYHINEKGHRSK